MIVRVCPAAVTVLIRGLGVPLAATVNETVPPPVPGVPALIVSQSSWLAASQLQSLAALTCTLPFPPAAVKSWLVAERV
jgi:hypothetical protein